MYTVQLLENGEWSDLNRFATRDQAEASARLARSVPARVVGPGFPPVEHREIRDSHGNTRQYVRLAGQSSWYRSLASAQIAYQRKGA